MVRIDYAELERELQKENKRHLDAEKRCFRDGHSGRQELLHYMKEPVDLDLQFQFIVSSSGVFEIGWEAAYRCSSCGWVYRQLMTPEEVGQLKKESDERRYAGCCVSA